MSDWRSRRRRRGRFRRSPAGHDSPKGNLWLRPLGRAGVSKQAKYNSAYRRWYIILIFHSIDAARMLLKPRCQTEGSW